MQVLDLDLGVVLVQWQAVARSDVDAFRLRGGEFLDVEEDRVLAVGPESARHRPVVAHPTCSRLEAHSVFGPALGIGGWLVQADRAPPLVALHAEGVVIDSQSLGVSVVPDADLEACLTLGQEPAPPRDRRSSGSSCPRTRQSRTRALVRQAPVRGIDVRIRPDLNRVVFNLDHGIPLG